MKILVLFYSSYGHIFEMAKAVAEGASSLDNMEVALKQVPETLPAEILDKMGASQARKAFAHIPIADPSELGDYDAIIFGAPTRYGMIASQMKAFIDGTGALWPKAL